jgi:cysteine synthase
MIVCHPDADGRQPGAVEERACGVVAVSGGNHAIAVAAMASALDIKATVVMPRSAPYRAVEAAEGSGAAVRVTDDMARLGLVICGGNVTFEDVKAWSDRFALS